MVKIIFERNCTTFDNEEGIASGQKDVDLSPTGIDQAKDMGDRYFGKKLDAIFISDLIRSYHTGEIAFYGKGIPIIQDKRLREWNYGDYNGKPKKEVALEKINKIKEAFPGGESLEEVLERMKSFLQGLIEYYDGKTVMIIGHRATQYALDYFILGKSMEELTSTEFKWQPGWGYELKKEMVQ